MALHGSSTGLPLTGGTLTGNLLFTDDTHDIGALSATRPRIGYFSRQLYVGTAALGGGIHIRSGSASASALLSSNADGVLALSNWNGNGFTSLALHDVKWMRGSGSPEGAATAPIGSFYSRTDGGANTSFYVKESGTGNTGWVAK